MISSLELDADGYPSEAALDAIRALNGSEPSDRLNFMRHRFVPLALELPYARCDAEVVTRSLTKRPMLRIEFATAGWSGCEDFIEAVLSVTMIQMLYYAEWKRGGLHVFEVPVE